MKETKALSKGILKLVNQSLKSSANSTTCLIAFQPKEPISIKKFSKLK